MIKVETSVVIKRPPEMVQRSVDGDYANLKHVLETQAE
jgi:hypothetical protein